MPATLVYQLALTRAEAGQYDQALALFKDRFFPSEEGGISAEQVQFEIRLMQAEAEARSGRCTDAEGFIAASHSDLEMNRAIAQVYVRMGVIARICQQARQSEQLLQLAAASKDAADSAWVDKAQRLLGNYDPAVQERKLQALTDAESSIDTNAYNGRRWYDIGMIEVALHHSDQARDAFDKALLLPDSLMSHHFARVAKAELSADQ